MQDMNRKYIFVTIFVFVFSFFFLTFGFCAFTSDLTINDVGVTVRQPLDVRVTGLYLNDISSGVVVNNQDYNTKRIMSDIVLPENGFITYKIEFTNYTTCPVYLLQITGLAGNLKYEIDVNRDDKYSLSDLFIEKEYGIRELFVTISYKDNGYNSENEQISLDFGFYFESSYTIVFHSENGMLPFEYQQLEYIETTGTEWINTNYIPNSNTTIELKVAGMTKKHAALYCARTTQTLESFTAFLLYGTDLRVDFGTSQTQIGTYEIGVPYIYKHNKRNVYVNNEFLATVPNEIFNAKYNMYLLASHVSEDVAANIGDTRLYYVKIWDNDTLVRDFIPCYRKSDGDVGLYDLVNNEFYFKSSEEMKDLFAAADIIVSRAGANAICELLALKKPNILIPFEDGVTYTVDGMKYGTCTIDNKGNVSYTLKSTNMKESENFYTVAKITGDPTYAEEVVYYQVEKTTFIPATAIYYEDTFDTITYTDGKVATNYDNTENQFGVWMTDGTQPTTLKQTTDITDSEANPYGYETNYMSFADYSGGSIHYVDVSTKNNPSSKYSGGSGAAWPTANFTFTGTGFDVISIDSIGKPLNVHTKLFSQKEIINVENLKNLETRLNG